jgi:hypothetical protein
MESKSLPTAVSAPEGIDSRDFVIISVPKMGKGTILGALTQDNDDALVFDLERGGYEYIPARKISIYGEGDGLEQAYYNYIEYRDMLLKEKGRYKILIIDTTSELDRLSELGGTLYYMYNLTMGKNFNRDPKTREAYSISDPNFKMVTTLPDGAGYAHTRKWFMDQVEIFAQIAPYRIYAAHITDKYIKDNQKEEVIGAEIALTGQLKRIFASRVTSLAKLVAEDNKRYLNFEVANDSVLAGSRNPRLKGKILISEEVDGEIKTYWENIYKK